MIGVSGMKVKGIYFVYGIYIIVLLGLFITRIIGMISSDFLNVVYLIIFIFELAYCCGGYTGIPDQNKDTVETLRYKLESRNSDPLLIKPFILMFLPLFIFFAINYFFLK